MCRVLVFVIATASAMSLLAARAEEERQVTWEGQELSVSVSESTRGPGLSREKLLEMAKKSVAIMPTVQAPPPLPPTKRDQR